MRFVDTNVLIYAISAPDEDDRKRTIALELLGEGDLAISVQVLGEFYTQATRRSRTGGDNSRASLEVYRVDRQLSGSADHPRCLPFSNPHLQPIRVGVLGQRNLGRGAGCRLRCRVFGRHEFRTGLRWASGDKPLRGSVAIAATAPDIYGSTIQVLI